MAMGSAMRLGTFLNMINGDDKSVFKLTRSESIAMAEIMEKFLEQEKGWTIHENLGTQGMQSDVS